MAKEEKELSAQQLFSVRKNLDEEKKELSSKQSSTSSSDGWSSTLTWVMSVLLWYVLVQRLLLPYFMRTDPEAREKLLDQVPVRLYEYSEAAFFTAMVLNLLSFIFEETAPKRQLALLSALIKGLSWHCDTLIVSGNAIITFDAHGALMVPSRYVQWSCTTPTMLFTLSKISNFSLQEIVFTIANDVIMIVTGWIAAEITWMPAFAFFAALSFITFFVTLYMMYRMIASARNEAAENDHAKACLTFTWDSSLIIWSLFPVGWCLARTGIPWLAVWGEPLFLFSNFAAKVVFSSCILYNNFVTIAQRRLMAQLEQEHRDRLRMVEELKETVQSKDEFISMIGHELRTPLNAIIQLSNAIARGAGGKLGDKAVSWMDTIASSATHLLGIINDIISIKATRTLQVKQEIVSIGPIVDNVLRTLAPMAKRGVTLQKIMCDQMPPMVGDGRRLMQALSNIIGNAMKFTEKGVVSVRVYPNELGRNIIIRVVDSGCGIPQEKMSNLFKPFRQVDMSSKRKYGGTGLGLSIAKQLVEAHQGSIGAESHEGLGTTITLTLPVLQRETRLSLEKEFREAYYAAGFDFRTLVTPTDGASVVTFCPSTDTRKEKSTRRFSTNINSLSANPSSISVGPSGISGDSSKRSLPPKTQAALTGGNARGSIDMSRAVVENYRWSDDFGGEGLEEGGPERCMDGLASNQGVCFGGVAEEEEGSETCGEPMHEDRDVGVYEDEYEEEYDDEDDEDEDDMYDPAAQVSAAGALVGGPPGLAVALMSNLYDGAAPVEDIKEGNEEAEAGPSGTHEGDGFGWGMDVDQRPYNQPPDREAPIDVVPDYWLPVEDGGTGPPVAPADPSAYHPALKGIENLNVEDEDAMYAGMWHRPEAWKDDLDDNDHYKSKSRMSYEYRPSLDFAGDMDEYRGRMVAGEELDGLLMEEEEEDGTTMQVTSYQPVSMIAQPSSSKRLDMLKSIGNTIRKSIDRLRFDSIDRSHHSQGDGIGAITKKSSLNSSSSDVLVAASKHMSSSNIVEEEGGQAGGERGMSDNSSIAG